MTADQAYVQMLQVAATGLEARRSYVLALSSHPDGGGALEVLATLTANPAGAAVVNALGPIRQIVKGEGGVQRRYLVIVPGVTPPFGAPVQVQID